MFQRIEYNAMVPGKRYKVGETSGVFIKLCTRPVAGIWFLKFQGMEKDETRYTYLSEHYPVYQFIPQNPQWKMERRSVNMIVRRLMGDEHFVW